MQSYVRRLLLSLNRLSPVRIAVMLGTTYFFVQLVFIHRYGVSWDEPLHRTWGELFAEYMKTGDRGALLRIEGYGQYFGPLYFFAEYLTSKWLYATGLFTFVASNHLLNLVTASIGVGTVFVFAQLIGGSVLGYLSVFFLVAFPPFIAHSHYNSNDIPLMTALLLTATVFVVGLQLRSRWRLVLSGAMFGICIALKISAILMIPVFLITSIVAFFDAAPDDISLSRLKKGAVTLLISVVAAILGLLIAWPSAWGDPMLIPHAFQFYFSDNFWPWHVLYFAKTYSAADLPFYYTSFEFFLVTPLLITLFAASGFWLSLKLIRSHHQRTMSVLLVLWILIPFIVSCKTGNPRYNGMRHFFFCLPPIAILAALGCRETFTLLAARLGESRRWLFPLFAVLIMASLSREIAIVHPYEGAYRNEVARLLMPKDMDRILEVEYWGAVYKDGVEWLNEHAPPGSIICVPIGEFLIRWYPMRSDLVLECSSRSTHVMYYTRTVALPAEYRTLADPVFTISRFHSTFLKIFQLR